MAEIEIVQKGFGCERCKHKWVPRNHEQPRVCPKCKSPYWDRPKNKKSGGHYE